LLAVCLALGLTGLTANYVVRALVPVDFDDPNVWVLPPPPPPPPDVDGGDAPSAPIDEVEVKLEPRLKPGPAESQRIQQLPLWRRLYFQHFKLIRAAALLVPFILFGGWFLWRRSGASALERRVVSIAPDLYQLIVEGISHRLFRDANLRRISAMLRRHREGNLYDLDVKATVDATVRVGGLYTR